MDLLKEALKRKREELSQDFGGKKFVKRGEIEKKHLQRIREEERKELEAKAKTSSVPTTSAPLSENRPSSATAQSDALSSPKLSEAERKIDELVLSRAEVIRHLRSLKQPITLFGEDDDLRLSRLKTLLKSGIPEIDAELMEGQRNDFLMDLTDLRKREKIGFLQQDNKIKEKVTDAGKDGVAPHDGDTKNNDGIPGTELDVDHALMKAQFDSLCDEDKILVFFKKLLKEWEIELEQRPEAEKRTSKGKSSVATFKQCARYLVPLFDKCKRRALPADIRQALLIVVKRCLEKDYLAAMDQYIKLAIGNAPWPIGVTMVGIHERSAREKIYTNSVAHIMNDETTRKYLQSVKRLMTLCQRRYPSVPSKSVEFNSLANGSDLQSLLQEESAKKGSLVAEERLRLMYTEMSSP
ncbi:hypothetical protein KP509_20G033500 [Ceratopteris richardii]|uniref:Pre-mRNA-splicing factor 18 n=1 Tax=Ceratopteris richardii TaxID=49495 RepID=A0A8T2SHU2_CERRI|nr:hypothetical protein KP509_20G033500 [Ceratopteris richardii]